MPSAHQAALVARLKIWARTIRTEVVALYLAARDPRVPWYAKLVAAAVAAYALSPIDLIPDFIPIFGYLDDLILVPLGILLAVRLVPPTLMIEFRVAAEHLSEQPVSRVTGWLIVAMWVVSAALLLWIFWPRPGK